MPATVAQPPIPAPNGSNTVQVLTALRNAAISAANVDAGRANASGAVPGTQGQSMAPQPSQFTVTAQVVVPVTYSAAVSGATGATATVTVPQIKSITWTNNVTGETIVWTAPGKLFTGGTVGTAL